MKTRGREACAEKTNNIGGTVKMKKLLALVLALVMVLSLAACGAKEEAAEAPAAEAPAAEAAAPAEEAVLFARIADPDHLQRGYRPGAHFLLLVAQCYVPELSYMQLKRFREGMGNCTFIYKPKKKGVWPEKTKNFLKFSLKF